MVPPQRASIGRQRIEIRRIESEDTRQVCFSKRRAGLFNKVSDLSTLCGVQVAAVVFSPGGKVFSLGHPSVDSVLGRFLAETPEAAAAVAAAEVDGEVKSEGSVLEELNKKCEELRKELEMEKVRKEYWNQRMAAARAVNGRVATWMEADVKEEDVGDYRVALINVHEFVKVRKHLMLCIAQITRRISRRAPPPPLPSVLQASSSGFFDMSQLSDFQQMDQYSSVRIPPRQMFGSGWSGAAMGGGMDQDFGAPPPRY